HPLEAGEVAIGGGGKLLDLADGVGEAAGAVKVGHPAVAEGGGAPHGAGLAAGDHDWRAAGLGGRGVDAHPVDVVEAAVVANLLGDGVGRGEVAADPEGVDRQRLEGLDLFAVVGGSEPELELLHGYSSVLADGIRRPRTFVRGRRMPSAR